jgi:hypothetical protein
VTYVISVSELRGQNLIGNAIFCFFQKPSEPLFRFGVLDDACPDFRFPAEKVDSKAFAPRLTPIVAQAKVD